MIFFTCFGFLIFLMLLFIGIPMIIDGCSHEDCKEPYIVSLIILVVWISIFILMLKYTPETLGYTRIEQVEEANNADSN